jgi:hypothetical protein
MNNWTNCNYSLNKIDVKKTLQELHQRFPDLTIEDLFDILDCIKVEYSFTTYANSLDINQPSIRTFTSNKTSGINSI